MNSFGERRIYPPKEHEGFLTELTGELRLFETKQKALMFAAALGAYRGGERTASGERGRHPFRRVSESGRRSIH